MKPLHKDIKVTLLSIVIANVLEAVYIFLSDFFVFSERYDIGKSLLYLSLSQGLILIIVVFLLGVYYLCVYGMNKLSTTAKIKKHIIIAMKVLILMYIIGFYLVDSDNFVFNREIKNYLLSEMGGHPHAILNLINSILLWLMLGNIGSRIGGGIRGMIWMLVLIFVMLYITEMLFSYSPIYNTSKGIAPGLVFFKYYGYTLIQNYWKILIPLILQVIVVCVIRACIIGTKTLCNKDISAPYHKIAGRILYIYFSVETIAIVSWLEM